MELYFFESDNRKIQLKPPKKEIAKKFFFSQKSFRRKLHTDQTPLHCVNKKIHPIFSFFLSFFLFSSTNNFFLDERIQMMAFVLFSICCGSCQNLIFNPNQKKIGKIMWKWAKRSYEGISKNLGKVQVCHSLIVLVANKYN